MTPTTQSVPAAGESTFVQASPKQLKGRHNGKIVFSSNRHNKALSIWSMNPDGSSPTRITDEKSRTERLPDFVPVYDTSPMWSPDGTKIAFISNRNYEFALYVMNADGSNSHRVTDVLEPGEPAWSPNGSKIAFSLGRRGTFGFDKPFADIYVVNVDGSGLTQLTRNAGLNSSPTWSPDGSKILFTHYRPCRNDAEVAIYVMNADGSDTRLLTNNPNSCGQYSSPRWSPDGTKIVASFRPHASIDANEATQIIVMNADGSNQVNISNRGQTYLNTGGSTFTDAQADWQPLPAPATFESSVVGFSAPSFTVLKDAGSVAITVTRTGNLKDVASCLYVTSEDGFKFNDPATTGTLRFARGEASKTISIALNQWNRSLKIVLSDNEGNASFVGGIKETTVTIVDRGTASRNPN